MPYNTIKLEVTKRRCLCRRCEKEIKSGEEAIAWRGVYLSPKARNLFFHIKCFAEMCSKVLVKNWYNNEA